MNTNFRPIQPLWDTFPASKIGASDAVREAAEGKAGGFVFADIFKAAVENVREAEDVVAKAEYQLSTGTLDNPAELSLELYKANTAMSLLVQLRQKALDAYSELSRLSI